ncbi:hypothetical protein M422DRAFT_39595 [Sphaerobolus stellatus SS14]|uniref:Uncharacterized protein n=1 Tax=Sphaerobolus stellatus (strain SS14) TaxID=990650 RepID=A0A0C9UE79_SPHS4|nr:hypothetical protein M422DRAFT_39595 [Sphaerobolus stellatus SS14]
MASSPLQTALATLRLTGPAIPLLTTLSIACLRTTNDHDDYTPIISVIVTKKTPRRALILSFLSIIAASFFIDGALVVARAVLTGVWEGTTTQWRLIEVADVLGLVAFAGLAALGTWKDVNGIEVWTRSRLLLATLFALAVDITQVVLLALSVNFTDTQPRVPPVSRWNLPNTLHFGLVALRTLSLAILASAFYFPRISYVPASRDHSIGTEEANDSTNLLGAPVAGSSQYGTFSSVPQTPQSITRSQSPTPEGVHSSANPQINTPPNAPPAPLKPNPRKEVNEDPSWKEVSQRLRRLAPYLWPKKDKGLQILAAICILLLLVSRLVNLLTPLTLGKIVSSLETPGPGRPFELPWASILLYVILRFLQSPGGVAALRDTLWAPVMQYSDREMSQLSFDHLLNLSLAFHTRRKTGEVLRILDRGASINHILELLLFNIGPIFLDISIALVFFFYLFGWPLAVLILVVMIAYVYASVILTTWRTKLRRRMNDRDVITRGIHTDCLLNYETVKYFCGEEHEGERYQDAIREYQALEYKVMVSLNLLNLVQSFIFSLGILVGSMLVAMQITRHKLNSDGVPMGSSDFVVFITYLAQLYGPLNSLGYIYRSINQNLVDTERLMKLLEEPQEVKDKPNAPNLHVTDGEIEFENVSFSYDGRVTALNNISFKVPKGSSVALVGESGSGKSTVLRLLYRFYDLKDTEGRILIDGQDIREVTQQSLRKAIGVVPQDSVLFNSSIGYNIGYGKFGATPAEIEAAAQAAQMHERIMTFPDGYDTKVGERGVRLSGGEKQRVAIARTLLKNPPILLLDEATSALDTSTEKDIQKALQNLIRGRSSLTIAHRLSTIANADIILVLKEGQIVESGSFRELLTANGVFASMWADQVSADEEAQLPDVHASQKEAVAGYAVADVDTKPEEPEVKAPEPQVFEWEQPNLEEQDPFADQFSAPTEEESIAPKDVEHIVVTESPRPVPAELPKEEASTAPEDIEHIIVTESPRPVSAELPKEEETQVDPAPVTEPARQDPVEPEQSTEQVPEQEKPEETRPLSYAEAAAAHAPENEVVHAPENEAVHAPAAHVPEIETTPRPFPSTEAPAVPIAFPSSQAEPEVPLETPVSPTSVTFSPTATPPSRAGTPDPEGKYKRIRKTSQNIQKFAQRSLSFVGRKQSSGTVSTKVESNSPRTSKDEARATTVTNDSGSVAGDSATDRSIPVTGSDDKKDAKGKGKKGKKGGARGGK